MVKQEEYKDSLLNFDLKSFLELQSSTGLPSLKKLYPDRYRLLADQIKLYPKAAKKLPVFAEHFCCFTAKSFEQSSSEALARFKAGLFSGETIIDLTGGLGIDDWAFSGSFNKVISVERDKELNLLARVNFKKLGIVNVDRVDSDAEDFIKNPVTADMIYIDADRRPGTKRTITLEDSQPNVLKLSDRLFEISDSVLLKLSPLIDITYLKRKLPNIQDLYVISLDNEIREILVLLRKDTNDKHCMTAVDIDNEGNYSSFSGSPGYIPSTGPPGNTNQKYFYESSKSIVKAGLAGEYAVHMELERINANGVYLLGNVLQQGFMGRVFRIIKGTEFGKSGFKTYLKDNGITKANVSSRNFPLGAEELKKQYKLSDGGDDYLFFTSGNGGLKLFFHCRKL